MSTAIAPNDYKTKAAACREHAKAQPQPINIALAYADFSALHADSKYSDTTEAHYRFYVRELKLEVASSRESSAFSALAPGTVAYQPLEPEPLAVLTVKRMADVAGGIDPRVLIPLRTGTGFDAIVSKRGGVMPGTVNMITGESGAGKTTVCANIATFIKAANPGATAGIIQAEMNRLDWYEECADNAMLAQLDIVFLLNLLDAPNFLELVEEALGRWDFCIVDSFEVILEQLREVKGWTAKKAEKELINLLNRVAEAGKSLFVIQHYTKGGTYAGSTKIKHLTTAMIFVMFDKNNERYVTFTKNRRCGHMVNKRLYFTKDKQTGQLVFDQRRFENEEAVAAHVVVERDALNREGEVFNELHQMMLRNQGAGLSDEESALANNTYLRSQEPGRSLFDLPEQTEDEFAAANPGRIEDEDEEELAEAYTDADRAAAMSR